MEYKHIYAISVYLFDELIRKFMEDVAEENKEIFHIAVHITGSNECHAFIWYRKEQVLSVGTIEEVAKLPVKKDPRPACNYCGSVGTRHKNDCARPL